MFRYGHFLLTNLGLLAILEGATPVPSEIFFALGSLSFQERVKGEAELLNWAREAPALRAMEIINQSEIATDPEVRSRCLSVAREMAMSEYLSEGEGYIGILMQEEMIDVEKYGIRVTAVIPEGPAARGPLRADDIIVGLDGETWNQTGVTEHFGKKIRQTKPGTLINLNILRNKIPLALVLSLDRRPPVDGAATGFGQMDLQARDRLAKEEYFKKWLERHREKK